MKKIGYVSSFVLPVPRKNMAKYVKQAKVFAKCMKDHGAIDYYECMGDDVPAGKVTSFAKSVKLKPGEVVVIGTATFGSRKAAERGWGKVMSDPRLASMDPDKMPFDGMRMFWGGFKPIVKG